MIPLVAQARVRAKMLIGKSDQAIKANPLSAYLTADLLEKLADEIERLRTEQGRNRQSSLRPALVDEVARLQKKLDTLQERHNRLQKMKKRLGSSNAAYSQQVRALKRAKRYLP